MMDQSAFRMDDLQIHRQVHESAMSSYKSTYNYEESERIFDMLQKRKQLEIELLDINLNRAQRQKSRRS